MRARRMAETGWLFAIPFRPLVELKAALGGLFGLGGHQDALPRMTVSFQRRTLVVLVGARFNS